MTEDPTRPPDVSCHYAEPLCLCRRHRGRPAPREMRLMLYVILGACGPGDTICRHSRPMQERELPPVSVTWQNAGSHLQSEWAYMGQHCSCVPQTSCSLHCAPPSSSRATPPPPSPRTGFERTLPFPWCLCRDKRLLPIRRPYVPHRT